ncbi:hypothetical protein [Microbacterium sp.]|uniref:hypothetical protein n=1 Tax=Microbacterium sp. TaxID=51671 RepID=UPI0039E4524C
MSTRARKARKRAGIKHTKPAKTPTYTRWDTTERRGLGLTTGAEIIASIVTRGIGLPR